MVRQITDSVGMNLSKLQGVVKDRGAWWAADHGVTKSRTQRSDWTATTKPLGMGHTKVRGKSVSKGDRLLCNGLEMEAKKMI